MKYFIYGTKVWDSCRCGNTNFGAFCIPPVRYIPFFFEGMGIWEVPWCMVHSKYSRRAGNPCKPVHETCRPTFFQNTRLWKKVGRHSIPLHSTGLAISFYHLCNTERRGEFVLHLYNFNPHFRTDPIHNPESFQNRDFGSQRNDEV